MEPRTTLLTGLVSIAMLVFVSPAASAAQPTGSGPGKPAQSSVASVGTLKSAQHERAQMSRAFTKKWSNYVQRVYGVEAGVWSQRMAPSLAMADASNLRNALQRDTFEGAMAEVGGVGAKLSDDQVIAMLAASKGSVTPQVLGALTNDLVYTPVQPCRILDTRIAGGAIAANSARSFLALTTTSYSSQGGSLTVCGISAPANTTLGATAVAVNLTAVSPVSAGFATAYPYATTRPEAASINYAAGAIVNNGLIIQIPNPLALYDFTLYTLAQSHYVADIVGYFAPPVATDLQCVTTVVTTVALAANGSGLAVAPSCEAGYSRTGTDCRMGNYTDTLVGIEGSICFGRAGVNASNINVSSRCCRIPGR